MGVPSVNLLGKLYHLKLGEQIRALVRTSRASTARAKRYHVRVHQVYVELELVPSVNRSGKPLSSATACNLTDSSRNVPSVNRSGKLYHPRRDRTARHSPKRQPLGQASITPR